MVQIPFEKIILDSKHIIESLFSARWLINEKSHTQNTSIQFSMDLELVLVDLWSNRTLCTQYIENDGQYFQ